MKLETPRCPSCAALLDGPHAGRGQCRYCGATIVRQPEAGAPTETRYSLVLRVGPSNVERVAALLGDRLGLAPDEARAKIAEASCEIEVGLHEERARELWRELGLAGARAEVVERVVEVPLVRVRLDGVGEDRLAAIVVVRQHLDLDLREARRLVERAPVVLADSMDERRARVLVAALEKAGARARIE